MDIKQKKVLTHTGRFTYEEVIAFQLLELVEDDLELVRVNSYPENDMDIEYIINYDDEPFSVVNSDQSSVTYGTYGNYNNNSICTIVFILYWNDILEKLGHTNPTNDEFEEIYKTVFNEFDKGLYEGNNNSSIMNIIDSMNYDDVDDDEKQMLRFKDAVKYSFDSLVPLISSTIKTFRANKKMIERLENRTNLHYDGRVVLLEKDQYINEKILEKINSNDKIKFVLQPQENKIIVYLINQNKFTRYEEVEHSHLAFKICEDYFKKQNRNKFLKYGSIGAFSSLILGWYLTKE